MMKRREFLTLLGGAAVTWPVAAGAQQVDGIRRIGVLTYWTADDAEGQARLAAFAQALKQLGWSEGRNLRIDTRWANADDIRRHAAELPRSRRMSSWLLLAPQPWRRCYRRPAPCRSCS
jgi:putative ABC transport system substrate-binding protein